MKCYKIIIQGYDDECGVIYAPQDWSYPIAEDGKDVNNWQSLKLELRDGIYCHYHMCIGGANLVDDEMKRLFEQYITEDTQIEFLPVQVYSEIYGEKRYYILHFKKIHDVLDLEHTVYSYNRSSIIKPVFNISKVRGMHLFNSRPAISDVNVSEMLYKAIKKNNLAKGIQFQPIKCLGWFRRGLPRHRTQHKRTIKAKNAQSTESIGVHKILAEVPKAKGKKCKLPDIESKIFKIYKYYEENTDLKHMVSPTITYP